MASRRSVHSEIPIAIGRSAVVHPAYALPRRVGRYELVEALGSGGMASVFAAYRLRGEDYAGRCAVKLILPRWAHSASILEMFRSEVRVMSRLQHPNIVRFIDAGEHDGECFMVLEIVDGISCARLLQCVARKRSRIPPAAALFVVREALKALAYAHGVREPDGSCLNIVHRDISPGNILISHAGQVKVTDFGIALSRDVQRHTQPGELKGKYGYMSPEQITANGDVDQRTDLFALGVVLAEMLIGRRLFVGKTQFELLTSMYSVDLRVFENNRRDIPQSVAELVYRALARDPSERFQSAAEFAASVRGVAHGEGLFLDEQSLVASMSNLGVLPTESGTVQVDPARLMAEPPTPATYALPAEQKRHSGSPAHRSATWEVNALLDKQALEKAAPAEDAEPRSFSSVPPTFRDQAPLETDELAELVARLALGGLSGHSTVRVASGRIRFIGDVPELARLSVLPAYQPITEDINSADWRAPIARMQLPMRLFDIVRSNASGSLLALDGWRHKRVYFRDGAPCFVASSERHELLGQRLIRAGLVAPSDIDAAVCHAGASGQRLGQVLLGEGLIAPGVLMQQLACQVEERVQELCSWGNGELVFVEDCSAGISAPPARQHALAIVAQSIRHHYSDGEIAALLANARHSRIVALHPLPDWLRLLRLSRPERITLDNAHGARVEDLVIELGRAYGLHASSVFRGLFIGLSARVIRFED